MNLNKIRIMITLSTLVVVGVVGYFATSYARGYRFDLQTFKFKPSGLLIVKSDPDGASIYVNSDFKTATNATINLSPGTYDIAIKKEGYREWQKRIKVEREVVTEIEANLFKIAPSLSAVTFSGSLNPIPSPDFTKIAYIVPLTAETKEKEGLWVIETVDLPLGFAKEPKRITEGDLSNSSFEWSPDGREILLTTDFGVFLLDAGTFTSQGASINTASRKEEILASWKEEELLKNGSLIKNLPLEVQDVLKRKTERFLFSPDETKVIYTASALAELPSNLKKALPGASTQKEERSIKGGQTYVYDIKEDRNFLIAEDSTNLIVGANHKENAKKRVAWFPTSTNIVLADEGRLIILDYDGTNRQEVYSGSFVAPHAFPTVNRDRLLILTNLGSDDSQANLYTLGVK